VRICLVGKYPPWQGGTSAQTLWLAYRLIQAGCEVSVVTLAPGPGDVEQAQFRPDEWRQAIRRFPELGAVRRVELESEPAGASSIPRTDAYVTRLTSAVLDEADHHGCEVVVGVYLEPFGLAAGMAASRRNLPLLLIHAGSDLHRLAELPSRRAAYAAVIAQADAVVTTPEAARQVLALGGDADGLIFGRPLLCPRTLFTEPAPPLELAAAGRPVIGMYGKLAVRKGAIELLEGAAVLAREGLDFSLLFMTAARSPGARAIQEASERLGLSDRVTLLPFLPPWRVPEFLATCDCVAFLENRFGVAVHRPGIPREVATAGRALIISGEVADYQRTLTPLVDGENVLIVQDPLHPDELVGVLRRAVSDGPLRDRLATAGPGLFRWSSKETSLGWTEELISFCRELVEQRRARDMSLQAFQTALLRIYAEPRHRERLLADPSGLAAEPELDQAERAALEALLHDREHLERYCRSLMTRKLRALERGFGDVLAAHPEVREANRDRFRREWVLLEREPGAEQHEFGRLIGASAREVLEGDKLRAVEQWVVYRRALSAAPWHAPETAQAGGHEGVAVSPAAELLHLQGRLANGRWSLEQDDWYLAVIPDPDTLQARTFELTAPVWHILAELEDPLPAETLVERLVEGEHSPETRAAAARAIEHLRELGVLG
jgi:glycosyltransferase involved in cell wall biosynthesis